MVGAVDFIVDRVVVSNSVYCFSHICVKLMHCFVNIFVNNDNT